jgi:carboxymethylenebutenolidase
MKRILVGGDVVAYESFPSESRESASPAILLLSAIAGVNDYMTDMGRRIALRGYRVLLLDYFGREGRPPDVSTPEAIGRAVAGLPDARVLADIRRLLEYLRGQPAVDPSRIATLGFCIGGTYSLLAACENPGLAAAVSYYGAVRYTAVTSNKPASPLESITALQAPLLAHFGNCDRLIPSEDVDALEQELRRHTKAYELFVYRGAPHAFDEHFRPAVYRPAASSLAWERSMAFLGWYLRGARPE